MIRTFKVYSHNNFQMHSTVLLTIVTMLYTAAAKSHFSRVQLRVTP